MSGGPEPEERDLRAAEYVLGTLDAAERAAFALERAVDPATEAAVGAWERRLAPLALAVPETRPAPALWERIARALPGSGAANDDRLRDLTRKLRFWRFATAGAGLAAAGLALTLAGLPGPAPPEGLRTVAVVTSGGDLPALIVSVDTAAGTARVRPVAAQAPSGRSLELWYIGAGAAPKPIGLVGGESSRIALPPEAARSGEGTIAVSVEPPGGSPTGQPTGQVIYSGRLIRE